MSDFNDVKEYLQKHGWIKGAFQGADGNGFCLIGALHRIELSNAFLWSEKEEILYDVVLEQYPDRCDEGVPSPTFFNDHPDTRLEDVFVVLDKAQVRLEERLW